MIRVVELPKDTHIKQCHQCGTWFSYNVKEDLREDHDRDGVYLSLGCPKCGVWLTVGVK